MTARALIAALLLAGPAIAQEGTNRPEDGAFVSQVVFTCERGVRVPVAYVNTPEGDSFAVIQIDGRQVPMIQTVSGSGIRYRSVQEDQPYVLHAKGEEAIFLYGAGDDPADLLMDCKADMDQADP